MYVTSIQRISSAAMRGGESWISKCVGMLCWERIHVDEGASSTRDGASVFVEELQRTANNCMYVIRYINQMS